MKLLRSKSRPLLVLALMIGIGGLWLFACFRPKPTNARRPILSVATAAPVLEALASDRPPQLKEPNESNWRVWAQQEDNIVRARLEQGALDSMINLLLFGTSFTNQPRVITVGDFDDPVLQARVADLVEALRNPKNNERLIFLR